MPRTSPIWTIVADYHIEKGRLPVAVVTTSGERLRGDLFVSPDMRGLNGFEGAPEILNAPEPFFPLAMPDGRTLLCAKAHVREVHTETDVVARDAAIGARSQVAVRLAGGGLVQGTTIIELESARQRVLDTLNRAGGARFIEVFTAEGTILVNRELIVHVEQVS